MSNNSSIIKAYKGFNKDMTCKGFKYKEGKEYEIKGELEMCYNGFHACINPLDVFKYYHYNNNVYHEVELSGDIIKNYRNTKLCASKIKIGRRLDPIKDMIEPNLDTDTEVVSIDEYSIERDNYFSYITNFIDEVVKFSYDLTKGVIGSYLVLHDIIINNNIALKVDGERIKEDCYYRYYDGKIHECNKLRRI